MPAPAGDGAQNGHGLRGELLAHLGGEARRDGRDHTIERAARDRHPRAEEGSVDAIVTLQRAAGA